MVLLDWLPLAALRSLTFHFFVFFFSKAFGWLVFDVVFFSKNHWRQLVGCCCYFCLFFFQVGGWSSSSFSKAFVVGVDCLQKIYFALHGSSFKDVVVIFFAQVGGLPLATRDMCRDAGDVGVTMSHTTLMHHINDHSNNSSSIFSAHRYTYLK